jgi:hypothetical protein
MSMVYNTGNTALTQQQQAALAAQTVAAQRDQNRAFMALSIRKKALAQQANGGANSQSFSAGQPLTYNIPTANNGYLIGFWVNCQLTNTLGTGTSAVYGLTAAAPLSLIDSIVVNYGGPQHNFRPAFLKYYWMMQARLGQSFPRTVLAGQLDSTMQAYYNSTNNNAFPVVAGSGNTWNFRFFVPMNLIHPQDVRGILPIQNGETTCQVVINCAGSPQGTDPLLATTYPVSGSGHTSTVTGTISVEAVYKDGQSYSTLSALQPNLSGVQTCQFVRDTPLNNLGTGQMYRNKVSFLHKIPWLWIAIIDGNQSAKFAATTNLQVIEASADATGMRPFMRYGLNTNLDVRSYYDDLSLWLEQDMDEGLIPLVYGPIFEQGEPGILEGMHYLDMTTQTGWTDFHYGCQVSTVQGVASISPRIECSLILLNDPLVI